MKAHLLSLVVALGLFGCGETSEVVSKSAEVAVKSASPVVGDVEFKVQKLDVMFLADGLPLGEVASDKSDDGEQRWRWEVKDIDRGMIEAIGNQADDVRVFSGHCMSFDKQGNSIGWPADGVCSKLFTQLTEKVLNQKDYALVMMQGAGLSPRVKDVPQANFKKGTMSLELDNDGYFFVRNNKQ